MGRQERLFQFAGRRIDTTEKYLALAATAKWFYNLGKGHYDRAKMRFTYTISVDAEDAMYVPLHLWILDQISDEKRKDVIAFSHKNDAVRAANDEDDDRETALRIRSAVNKAYTFQWRGYTVHALTERQRGEFEKHFSFSESLTLTTHNKACRDELLKVLAELAAIATEEPGVYRGASWGDWNRTQTLRARSIDTVVLREGLMEEIVADFEQFLDSEDWYEKLGIPWHRGYLFHGPPGTGKTSLGHVLSSHFGLDVYAISLSDVRTDSSLQNLLARIQPYSVLLLEDIDVLHAAKERDDDNEGMTASGLLNALDGISTPHGLITILTTNDFEVLDKALVRPGRADLIRKIDFVDEDQLNRMITTIYGPNGHVSLNRTDMTPAMVMEAIKANVHDQEAALQLIKEIANEETHVAF